MSARPVIAGVSQLGAAVSFEQIFERTPMPLALAEVVAGRILLVAANGDLRRTLGLSALDIAGRGVDLFLTETSLVLEAAVQRTAATGETARLTLDSLRATGAPRHDIVVTAVLAAPPSAFVLLAIEPHPQRSSRASAVTLDDLEALGEGLIVVFDVARKRARYMSVELARILGQDMEGPFDETALRSLIHPDDYEGMAAFITGAGPYGEPGVSSITVRVARPEGGWRWLEVRGRALTFGPDGRARRVLAVAVDITERRAVARALDRAARAVLWAGEQERRKVARNLHDSTSQHLVAIDLGLSGLERRMSMTGEAADIVRDMREALASAHREIRTYSYLLHPPQLQRLGLAATLTRFVEGFGRRSDLDVEVRVSGRPVALSSEVELTLFRVAQEAVMNVHRHARASSAVVRLQRSADTIVLEVEDNGIGLAGAFAAGAGERADGVGVPGMRARMAQVGGMLEMISLAPGLCVRATAPI